MKLKLLVSVVIISCVAGVWGWFFMTNEKSSQTTKDKSSDIHKSNEEIFAFFSEQTEPLRWALGYQYLFKMEMTSALLLEEQKEPSMAFELSNNWEIIVLEQNDSDMLLYAKFIMPNYKITNEIAKDASEKKLLQEIAINKSFVLPYFIKLKKDGAVKSISFSPKINAHAQSVLKSMAGLMQFVKPTNAVDDWKVEEIDSTGKYIAEYLFNQKEKSARKIKLEYLQVGEDTTKPKSMSDDDKLTAVVLESNADFLFFENGPIKKLQVKDHLQVNSGGLFASGKADTTLEMSLLNVKKSNLTEEQIAGLISLANSYSAVALNDALSRSTRRKIIDEQKIAGMDYSTAMELLNQNTGNSKAEKDKRHRIFLGLEALLRQNKKSVELAVDHIKNQEPRSKTLIRALGYAGSEESQNALIDLFDDASIDSEQKEMIFASMYNAEEPSQENIDFHKSYLNDEEYHEHAKLGLGAISKNLRTGDQDDKAEEVLDYLVDVLEKAQTENEIIIALQALGNSGHPRLLQILLPFLNHTSPNVRMVAINSLRVIPDTEAELLIIEKALTDNNVSVREKAVIVMQKRPASLILVRGAEQILKTEKASIVQYRTVQFLVGKNIPREILKPILEWVLQNLTDKRCIELAKKAL